MIAGVKSRLYIVILSGILGIAACHGDARYASDVNADLLTHPTNSFSTTPITIQGTVSCNGCQADGGMAIVITSALGGQVAQRLYDTIGGYSLSASVRPGDVLEIKISVIKASGPVMRSAAVSVPSGTATVLQDFMF